MDKYSVYNDIHERLINSTLLAGSEEGALIVGVIGQAIQDAMGLYNSECEKVYVEGAVDSKLRRKWITRQQDAINWFKDKGHYSFADMVEIDPTWITHLLRTKGAVAI